MKIYHIETGEEILDPDLSNGYLVDGVIQTGSTEETIEVMEDTISESNPEGLRHIVPSEPIYEDCKWYYPNSTIPSPQGDSVSYDELAKAYNEGVMSIGE